VRRPVRAARAALTGLVALTAAWFLSSPATAAEAPPFLQWSPEQARKALLAHRRSGHAGKSLDLRVTSTHRAFRYKVRATLWTPEALQGAVRLLQLRDRMPDAETIQMLAELEALPFHVLTIEIDPDEGSGVIPMSETRFFLQRRGDPEASVRPAEAREVEARDVFRKAGKRDYAYDLFVVAFPRLLREGEPLLTEPAGELELVVDIAGKSEILSFPAAP